MKHDHRQFSLPTERIAAGPRLARWIAAALIVFVAFLAALVWMVWP